jgi:hypothetical protein
MRVAAIAIALLAALVLATYPIVVAGWLTGLVLLGAAGVLATPASLWLGKPWLGATAALLFGIEYAAALIVERVSIDVFAVFVGMVWLLLVEPLEWVSLCNGAVAVDGGVLAAHRRFMMVEFGVGGLAASVALGAAAAVGDRSDPVLFTLGAGCALLAAGLVITIGRRSVNR